jgi:hypothetical protein
MAGVEETVEETDMVEGTVMAGVEETVEEIDMVEGTEGERVRCTRKLRSY